MATDTSQTADPVREKGHPSDRGPAVACCAPLTSSRLTDEEAETTAELFKALADPNRIRIVNLLAANESLCVCEFVEPLGLSQPTVSHHLKRLADVGLLERERRGSWVHYALSRDGVRRLAAVVHLEER